MATKEEIAAYFQELNVTISDEVLNKCLELCNNYNIDAEYFCDQWYAYAASNIGGAAPTIEHLEKLERKELHKSKDQQSFSTPKRQINVSEDLDNGGLVSSYSATPKRTNTPKSQTTPIQNRQVPKTPIAKDILHNYGPGSPSLSETYCKRSDSRSVQCSYGPSTALFKKESSYPITIKNATKDCLKADVKYMYEILGKKVKALASMTQHLGNAILEHHGLVLTDGLLKTHLGETTTYGRIVSDSDGKINAQSILLEGTQETNLSCTTTLNLNKVSKYSLFPGQVVVVQGNNVSANALIAEKIYSTAELSLPEDPPVTKETMQIVVAAGPFTLQDNLSYEPLNDLLKYVNEYQPHVLILLGPFLDKSHESIFNGGLMQTFDSFFEGLIENVMNSLQNSDTQVIVVSSLKDAHHHPTYPTPPYRIREQYSNLTFVTDPCLINIDGLVIAATTADVLFHISNFELFQDKNPTGSVDRMGRIASHLLNQQCFYPLYPTPKGMCIDHELLEQFGVLDILPHILIVPSNLRHFVKNIQDCLVVNPERLTKGYVAGTFARIEISAGSSMSICNRTAVQVIRV